MIVDGEASPQIACLANSRDQAKILFDYIDTFARGLDTKEKLEAIPGTPPNMIYPPKGDAFAERNKYALKIDFEKRVIIMDRTFAKKAENTMSSEYAHLQRVRADYPTFKVERKQIKKNKNSF